MNISGKLNAIKQVATSSMGMKVLQLKKNSPTLMFGAGVVGVVGTVVLASKATLQLESVLDEHENTIALAHSTRSKYPEKYSDADLQADIVKMHIKTGLKVTKIYGPAFALGAVSIACLTGAHISLQRRNAGLMAAYVAVDKAFKEYRARVLDDVGADKDREYRYGSEEITSEVTKKDGSTKKIKKNVVSSDAGHSMYARFFTMENENWNPTPENNLMFLSLQQKYLNHKLNSNGHVFLNEAYDVLGLERVPEGQVVGWLKKGEGDGYIDFGIWDDSNCDRMLDYMNGHEDMILVDFNVDGVVFENI